MAQTNQAETPAEREARLTHEQVMLEEGYAAHKAGRFLSGEALNEWLATFVGDGELPSPEELRKKYAAANPTADR